ncbi:MAG: hypothetical protein IJI06_02360 [Oscillospiraceae bacterium]|nr:hypothetical protein [Oscillospiraceae bacterium]
MSLTKTLACTAFALVRDDTPNTNYNGAAYYRAALYLNKDPGLRRAVFFKMEAWPAELSRNWINNATFNFTFNRYLQNGELYDLYKLRSTFDPTTITYNNMPTRGGSVDLDNRWLPSGTGQIAIEDPIDQDLSSIYAARDAIDALKTPGFMWDCLWGDLFHTGEYIDFYQPTLAISYESYIVSSKISIANAPTSGYINPREAASFVWKYALQSPDFCFATDADIVQASATLYWREGSSGNYTAIPISGSGQSITIPANTFPTGSSIQYYIEGTDTAGSTSQTPVYTLSTAAGLITATPVSPIGAVEDGSAAITLRWWASSNDGFPQNGANLQTSRDGSTWTDLASVTGTTVSYEIAADAFTAGAVYWRVRGYNIDGVAGSWSAAAQFVVVAAPPQPSVTVEAVPFATVNWQVEGQQAYRITVDGTVYGPYFGTVKTWTVPDYLLDGEHTITVEVQGVYGLWSQPGSASFTVQNQPGDAVTLSGEFERDGVLSWVTTSQTADFLIYRDGVQIGHASAPIFVDRFALGEHSYQVINRLPGGNYTASNIVTGTMLSCTAAIAPLTGGAWIELTLSENSNREESFTWTQAVSMRHFAGAEYPMAEQSPFADLSGSYDVSFADLPSAKAFEQLRGQAVVLKSRGGNVMIGILSTLSKRMTEFYIAFVFSLQRMHWRDFIDADSQL